MSYSLPILSYTYDALEPYFDKETMNIHYNKHHQNYVNNVNNVLKDLPEFANVSIETLIMHLDKIPKDKQNVLRNNAGGHANHSIFWKCLKKNTFLQGKLKIAIEDNFGSIKRFKELFENSAMAVFGSGWTWLVKKSTGLSIVATANQDNPLMGEKITGIFGYPILGLDVWEHAYYLKYQNKRLDYIKAFWNVVNWNEVTARYSE
ncbi:MAG: Fe-Mn family superoxide dismutase [Candidatus Dasytiphilus stammeri]